MKDHMILNPIIGNINFGISCYCTVLAYVSTNWVSIIPAIVSIITGALACINYIYQIRNNKNNGKHKKRMG